MEKWKRTIFFWFLVILFLTTAPAIILHSQGFSFDFQKGIFVHSGIITFKSNPQSVDVYLNGKKNQSQKMDRINGSTNISGLRPGKYNIKISAPDFQAWEKKTAIHSGLASEFWNVLLVRKNYKKTSLATGSAEKFFISPKNHFIAYTSQQGPDLHVKIFDISKQETVSDFIISNWNLVGSERKENIEWSPQENLLSVPVQRTISQNNPSTQNTPEPFTAQEFTYFIVNLKNKTTFSLADSLNKSDLQDVRWDPNFQNYIFYLEKNSLYRADIQNLPSSETLIAPDVSSYDLSESHVFYIQNPSHLVFKNNLDGKSSPEQITQSFPDDGVKSISRLIVYDDLRIAIISKNKNLYIFNQGDHAKYFKKLGENISGVHFSNDGKKIIFWSPHEISAYFLRDWTVQPIRQENETQNITRYSETLSNVQWFQDYEHVIFSSGRWVKIVELDQRDWRNCMDIFNTNIENPFIIFDEPLRKIYFTDQENSTPNIFSITFPEKNTFLGIGG